MKDQIQPQSNQSLATDTAIDPSLNKVDEAYSSEPWWYDLRGFLILTFAYKSTLPFQLRFFARNISANHLEAAIGSGTLLELILVWMRLTGQKRKGQITGFDYARRMLGGAQARFKKTEGLELVLADISALPFKSDSFDSCNIANSLHALPDPKSGLQELNRVLKPNGMLAANMLLPPSGNPLSRWLAHRINEWGQKKGILNRPYSAEETIEMIESAGFQLRSQNLHGNCLSLLAIKRS